jgi:hypothetical protein
LWQRIRRGAATGDKVEVDSAARDEVQVVVRDVVRTMARDEVEGATRRGGDLDDEVSVVSGRRSNGKSSV